MEENGKKTSFCAFFAENCALAAGDFSRLGRGLVFRLLTGWSGIETTAERATSVDCLHGCTPLSDIPLGLSLLPSPFSGSKATRPQEFVRLRQC